MINLKGTQSISVKSYRGKTLKSLKVAYIFVLLSIFLLDFFYFTTLKALGDL